MIFLGQLRHPNLVKLIGYCCEEEERVLVYEFMARGSLENHLFKSKFISNFHDYFSNDFIASSDYLALTGISVCLPWGIRIKIAIGAAKGLAFLHGAESPVIYRDFKTSNILLDSVCFSNLLSPFELLKPYCLSSFEY